MTQSSKKWLNPYFQRMRKNVEGDKRGTHVTSPINVADDLVPGANLNF